MPTNTFQNPHTRIHCLLFEQEILLWQQYFSPGKLFGINQYPKERSHEILSRALYRCPDVTAFVSQMCCSRFAVIENTLSARKMKKKLRGAKSFVVKQCTLFYQDKNLI